LEKFVEFCFCFGGFIAFFVVCLAAAKVKFRAGVNFFNDRIDDGFSFLERSNPSRRVNGFAKKTEFFAKTEKTTKGNVLPVLWLLHLGGGSKFPENLRLQVNSRH